MTALWQRVDVVIKGWQSVCQREKIHSYVPQNFPGVQLIISILEVQTRVFFVAFCRTNMRQFCVHYQGPSFFNTLNTDIRNASSVSQFKFLLKKKNLHSRL